MRTMKFISRDEVTHDMALVEKILYITSQVTPPIYTGEWTSAQMAFNDVMPPVLAQMAVRYLPLLHIFD